MATSYATTHIDALLPTMLTGHALYVALPPHGRGRERLAETLHAGRWPHFQMLSASGSTALAPYMGRLAELI